MMSKSSSKFSFNIDNILCQTTSTASVSVPTDSSYTNSAITEFSSDFYKSNMTTIPEITHFIPPRYYFSNQNLQHFTCIDQYSNTFPKVIPNNFIPYYSHPFRGYILPGCTFKRKGGQVRFTPQQTQNLEQEFNNHKYLSPEDRKKLARELKLSDRQVKTWFQNRRAKFRRTSVIGSSAKCDVICKNNLMHSHANCSYMREHPMDKPSEADQSQHDQFDDMKSKSNCTNF